MTEIELTRTNHLVDPVLAIWGWEVPVYLFLGGVTAGIMILTALLGRAGAPPDRSRAARLLPFAAPVLLSLGMLALFLDLEYKWHVTRFYQTFQPTSPMSWGSWILLGIYPVTLGLGLAFVTEAELQWLTGRLGSLGGWLTRLHQLARRWEQGLRGASIVLGLGLGIYTGVLLGTLAARAAWSSALLGPLFLVSGLSTGAAFLLLFPLADGEHRQLARWDLLAIATEVALLALFFIGLHHAGEHTARAAALFFGGRFTAPFWALVVVAGLVVPVLLNLLEHRLHLRPTRLAPVLVLVGGLSLRYLLVLAGQS